MAGSLLISGNPQQYNAIGEGGRPVFSVAFQLREVVRLKAGSDVANCLAIPQSNETGSVVDWYAPQSGPVVSWSAASDEERNNALSILDSAMSKLNVVAKEFERQAEEVKKSGVAADQATREKSAVFPLLNKVFIFPDAGYIFLVNGKPVVTFWGFHPHGASLLSDPFQGLRGQHPVAVAPAAVALLPARKGMAWWWWLLLIVLLLFLLLFGLRSCDVPWWLQGYLPLDCRSRTDVASVVPMGSPLINNDRATRPPTGTTNRIEQPGGRPPQTDVDSRVIPSTVVTVPSAVGGNVLPPNSVSVEQGTSDLTRLSPGTLQPDITQNGSQVQVVPSPTDVLSNSAEAVPDTVVGISPQTIVGSDDRNTPELASLSPNTMLPESSQPGLLVPSAPTPIPTPPPTIQATPAPAETPVSTAPGGIDPSPSANTSNTGQRPNGANPNLDSNPSRGESNASNTGQRGNPLRIPDSAVSSGSTRFLEGSWSAGTGMQDAATGRPVRLEYDFSRGNGQGKVTVNRGAGIQCSSPVTAQMQGKNVQINDGGLAKCSDGSTMALPKVTCVTAASGQADCQGRYDNGTSFPVSMRHAPK
jgi:hypothetical protein